MSLANSAACGQAVGSGFAPASVKDFLIRILSEQNPCEATEEPSFWKKRVTLTKTSQVFSIFSKPAARKFSSVMFSTEKRSFQQFFPQKSQKFNS
ncbi:MAG: hypothetical protein Q3X95_01615, partial [Duodenibacillus sp.]|nr:hypothetical protein [Duodenibacillus sp.]